MEEMLKKIAWNAFQVAPPGIEWEDLFSEAYVAYLEALQDYQPHMMCVRKSTWVWHAATHALQEFIRQEYEKHLVPTNPKNPQILNAGKADFLPPLSEILDGLSEDAREVCYMILSNTNRYAPWPPKKAAGKVQRDLRKKGWKCKKRRGAVAELRAHFANA